MKYENVERPLLDFLHNPMKQLDAMTAARPAIRWSTRLLYQVPCLRRLICAEQVAGLVLEKLLHGLRAARQSLPATLFEDHSVADQHLLERYIVEVEKYFSLVHVNIDPQALSPEQRQGLDQVRKAHTFAKLEYTCNRVAESLELREEHNLAILRNGRLWLSYYVSELYFLIAHGMMQAQLRGKVLYITPTLELQRRLKAYWLSEITEENTKFSDMRMLMDVAQVLQLRKYLPAPLKQQLINVVMDKCLSLHVDYVSPSMQADPQYGLMREVVYFAAHLELNAMLGRASTPVQEIRQHVSAATLDLINGCLQGRHATLDSANSFVELRGEQYQRGPVKLKYGVKKLIGQLLHKRFAGDLGKRFEVDYVLNYMRDLDDPRYAIHAGFKAETGAKVLGYDIDLVLQDLEEDLYYFIQVKYKVSELPVYFSEQCRLMANPAFRNGFDRQLAVLRENLGEPSIRQKLTQLGLGAAHASNSHFVLLHNLPFLNFYELDGIYFYEWNLLRNILRNGRVQYRNNDDIAERYVLNKARLHRPQEMVEAYFEDGQDAAQMEQAYQLYLRTHSVFAYDDLQFVCKVL